MCPVSIDESHDVSRTHWVQDVIARRHEPVDSAGDKSIVNVAVNSIETNSIVNVAEN